jgi:hypothetical protein
VFVEDDSQLQIYHRPTYEDWPTGGENWDEELLVPGRMFYIGQGQSQFLPFDQPAPGVLYPKRKKKKKKRTSPQPPPSPPPALTPAPIDWEDWEELCQFSPLPAPPVPPTPWEPED